MRIAISGSHSLGKSTFVADFLKKHPDYAFEQEPYRALLHQHKILFAEDQRRCDINVQLDYCIGRVNSHPAGSNVIFDRCPVDYIPYADYTAHFGHTDIDQEFVQSLYSKIRASLVNLDLIVFTPISVEHPIELEDDGHRPIHHAYRNWVDAAFKKLYREQLHTIFPPNKQPKLIEIWGDRETRLKKIAGFL